MLSKHSNQSLLSFHVLFGCRSNIVIKRKFADLTQPFRACVCSRSHRLQVRSKEKRRGERREGLGCLLNKPDAADRMLPGHQIYRSPGCHRASCWMNQKRAAVQEWQVWTEAGHNYEWGNNQHDTTRSFKNKCTIHTSLFLWAKIRVWLVQHLHLGSSIFIQRWRTYEYGERKTHVSALLLPPICHRYLSGRQIRVGTRGEERRSEAWAHMKVWETGSEDVRTGWGGHDGGWKRGRSTVNRNKEQAEWSQMITDEQSWESHTDGYRAINPLMFNWTMQRGLNTS